MFTDDDTLYAHPGQFLSDHCDGVATLAGTYGESLGMRAVAELAGLLHDVGKGTDQFQRHLRGELTPANYHTHQGALVVERLLSAFESVPGYVIDGIVGSIACHHGGLTRRDAWESSLAKTKSITPSPFDADFKDRLACLCHDVSLADNRLWERDASLVSVYLWLRMLYSCLVDADYVDTERAMDDERACLRARHVRVPLSDMRDAASSYIDSLGGGGGVAQTARGLFRDAMRDWSSVGRGIWQVKGACGVGKTLSSLEWALRHAVENGLDRVVYVIPYNTISDQTFAVFRDVFSEFGSGCVAEATSSFEVDRNDEESRSLRLSCENFDAEVIVTSSVNFFESLFSNSSSRSRKLHNIARSVIVVDEAQRMPADYLSPTLAALETLVSDFGCSVLMMSGTFPDFCDGAWLSSDSHKRIDDSRIDEANRLLENRVRYSYAGKMCVDDVCATVRDAIASGVSSALVVLNKKVQARVTAERFRRRYAGDGVAVYCLSKNMVSEHRLAVIDEVRERLCAGLPTVVFSTSLIEAGVDLSFGFAMRALAGLDSIVQTGGRVNRNGDGEQGVVIIFELVAGDGDADSIEDGRWLLSEKSITRQVMGNDVSESIAADRQKRVDCGDDKVSEYLRLLFYGHDGWRGALAELCDARSRRSRRRFGTNPHRFPASIDFEAIAKEYQLIKDGTECLVVPVSADGVVAYWKLRNGIRCNVDRYSVAIWPKQRDELVSAGIATEVCHGVCAISPDVVNNVYDEFGLVLDLR